jgi:membrane protein implicated in regulation of membrane protease activity
MRLAMLTVYWVCFAVGGAFVLLAIAGGHSVDLGDHDFDLHRDLESLHSDLPSEFPQEAVDGAADGDVDWVAGDRRTSSRRQQFSLRSIVRVFQSLKFWTFGACFFGLTGLILSNLSLPLPSALVTIAALGMGFVCGTFVSSSLQVLRYRHTDSLVRTADLTGQSGTVELPFNANSRGKIRLMVKGSSVSCIAYTDEQRDFQPGDRVLVVGTENNRLWIVSAEKYDL